MSVSEDDRPAVAPPAPARRAASPGLSIARRAVLVVVAYVMATAALLGALLWQLRN